jgi:hypothetical protein
MSQEELDYFLEVILPIDPKTQAQLEKAKEENSKNSTNDFE